MRNGSRAPRAEHARRRLHRDARRHRHRRLRRPRRRRHRPHLHRDAGRRHAGTSSSATCAPGDAAARGEQGSAAKWAHAAMALAVARARPRRAARRAPDPRAVLTMVERVMREGDVRARRDRRRPRSRRRPRAAATPGWTAVDLRPRRARAARAPAGTRTSATPTSTAAPGAPTSASSRGAVDGVLAAATAGGDLGAAAAGLFDACVAGDPLRAGDRLPRPREGEARRSARASRCASRWSPTAIGGDARRHPHDRGDPRARRARLRGRGRRHRRRRRPPAAAPWPRSTSPSTPGLKVGVPGLPAIVETLAEGRYDLVHLCSPGPGRRRRRR